MTSPQKKPNVRNYMRFSLIFLAMPILYIGLWFTIRQNETLTYFEQVQLLMSYFPDFIQEPRMLALFFFSLSICSMGLSFMGYLKSQETRSRWLTIIICCTATFVTMWLGMSLL